VAAHAEKKGVFKRQEIMRKVVYATLPCIAAGTYLFGWRVLVVALVAVATGVVCEYLLARRRGEQVSEAVFVTALLFAVIMPPTIPWHVVVIGMAFSIILTKEVFGGFGRNFFNPAMAGRCFVYIAFPVAMTAAWASPAPGMLGNLQAWIAGGFQDALSFDHWYGALGQWRTFTVDSITSASPMGAVKQGGPVPPVSQLLLGNLSGVSGATSALVIILGGLYLYIKKVANRTIILSCIITYFVLNQALNMLGVPQVRLNGFEAVLGGGFLFGAFYMATDPVSGPKTPPGRLLYGILIGTLTTTIRNFSIFNGGFMFSLLLANMFAPIIDYGATEWKKMRAAKGAAS
jgi:Na+-transporting NADH:ubiquinone oxidoreductase subunit B